MTARFGRLCVLTIVVVVASACAGGSGSSPPPASSTTSTPTTAPLSTTTTAAPTTTVPPSTTTTNPALPPPPPSNETDVLAVGSHGPRTQQLQVALAAHHYDPGPFDGNFGTKTVQAVWAFEHVHGLPADGKVTPALFAMVQSGADPSPVHPEGGPDHVEIDIAKQVLVVFQAGHVRLITHISSGSGRHYCDGGECGVAITPRGSYTVTRRISGWHRSSLGELYNPVYFYAGYAVHGSTSVPNGPASHGCVRIPMHIAEYFPSLVPNGEKVYVF